MSQPEMADSDERDQALKRIEAKRSFRQHATVYLLVNVMFVVIWALTSRPGYFWPIWPAIGWGIGLGFHAWAAYGQRPITEAEIQREIERGKQRGV